jgi:hypothetical protein
MNSTFAGSWNEIQQLIIYGLTEYMVVCIWSRLQRLSPFALDSLTLKFSYFDTSAQGNMRRYLWNYVLT